MPANQARTWVIDERFTPEQSDTERTQWTYDLAEKLTQHTWCLCQGWRWGDYLLLNDAFSEDGAGEWAVLRADTLAQVESITFGWMQKEPHRAMGYLVEIAAGTYDTGSTTPSIQPHQVQTTEQHGRCRLCA